MIAPVASPSSATALKAIGASQTGGRKGNAKAPCKFFSSKTGCYKGSACKFDHTFESQEDKKSRCRECGSQAHRKGDCPVLAARTGKSPKSSGKDTGQPGAASSTSTLQQASLLDSSPSLRQQAILESIQAVQNAVNGLTSSVQAPNQPASVPQQAPQVSASEPSRPEESEVKDLIKEANAMLSKLTRLQAMEVKTNESLGELRAGIKAAGLEFDEGLALLDTGASHAFKTAGRADVERAAPVRVELAGGRFVTLKQNKAGTLLAAADDPEAANATPILPLGALVQQLGCDLSWTRKGGLKVVHPQFGVLKTFVNQGQPPDAG